MAAHLGVADANAAVDYLKINVLNRCSSGWNDPILRDYLKDDIYQKIDHEKVEIKDGQLARRYGFFFCARGACVSEFSCVCVCVCV